jgi:hypothetical protein
VYPHRAMRIAISLTLGLRDATARAANAMRARSTICGDCRNTDEIRTSCNDGILLSTPRAEKFLRTRFYFCAGVACCRNICTGKNNFDKLSHMRRARTGIDQKMSESVASDSHPCTVHRPEISSRSSHARNFFAPPIQFSRADAAPVCRTAPKRQSARYVSARVSFSGCR